MIAKARLLAKTGFAGNLLDEKPRFWYNIYLRKFKGQNTGDRRQNRETREPG
jgi:hypothetical protein